MTPKQRVESFSVFSKAVGMRMLKNAQNPFKQEKKKKTWLFSVQRSMLQLSSEVSELMSILLNLAG